MNSTDSPSDLRRPGVPLKAILLLALALWGGEYFRRGLWEPDEARYAYVAREMRWNGNWFLPSRHGESYAHKPPLMFWLINAGSLLTGGSINSISARLPSLLGAILSLWAVCRLAALWAGRGVAWRVFVILPTTYLFWRQGGWAQIDSLLCGLEMMALYFLFTNDVSPSFGRAASAYAFMGLATLAKGPVGFIVPLGAYTCARWAAGEQRLLRRAHWIWGPLITLAFPAAWLGLAWLNGAPMTYFREILLTQSTSRVAGGTSHRNSFIFFLYMFPATFMPWSIFLPAAGAAAGLTPLRRRLLGWFAFVILFFSVIADKRDLYVLLAFPAAALFLAAAWDDMAALSARWRRTTAQVAVGFLLLLLIAQLGAAVYPKLPIARWVFWPGWMLAMAGAFATWRAYRQNGFAPRLLYVFAGSVLWFLACAGLFVLPALNPLKTPIELAREAPRLIAPGQPLLIYKVQAEILPLYANRPGRRVADVPTLMQEMERQGKGVAVFEQTAWDEVGPLLKRYGGPHPFRIGNKHLVWLAFDCRHGRGGE